MKVSNDEKLKSFYIKQYKINDIFSRDMSKYMKFIIFNQNEFIYREDEELNYIYFFVKGRLKVYRTLENGKALLLSFYYPLMVLGDLELVNYERADADIKAVEDSYCIGMAFEDVRDILLQDVKFLRYVCDSLGRKLKQTSKNSSINILYPLENRLAGYILDMIVEDGSDMVFNENLTETAEALGTSYRHLLRTLKSLCYRKILEKKKDYYEVIDIDTLKEISSDLYAQY